MTWAAGTQDELGVAAVERATHPAHHRHHLLPGPESPPGGLDHAGGLDPRHPREGAAVREALPEVELGAVDAERLTRIST